MGDLTKATTMGYRFIHRQAKIAAVRLYEHDLLALNDIWDICGFSRRTWFQILKLWNETGDVVRKRSQRRGRECFLHKEDLSYLLELVNVNPDYFLDEFLSLLQRNRFISIHYTTIHCELLRLRVSQKKLQKIAIEHDELRRADFIARMAMYSPDEIAFIDETSKDCRSVGRRYGRSVKNMRAAKKQPFVRGCRVSATGLLTLDGIIARTIVEESMTKELFLQFLEHNVVSMASLVLPLALNRADQAPSFRNVCRIQVPVVF
jgi:transposase